jgi:DNA-directed RNA polymerase subunit M/transcription elongation factor TFIIS
MSNKKISCKDIKHNNKYSIKIKMPSKKTSKHHENIVETEIKDKDMDMDMDKDMDMDMDKDMDKDMDAEIKNFNLSDECAKLIKLKTSAASTIRPDVILYSLQNINRKKGLFSLAEYVPFDIADQIEKGILEFSMIQISSDTSANHTHYPVRGDSADVINFVVTYYYTKIHDICLNLDTTNKKINNQTLNPALIEGSIDPYFVAFMTPQQLHPARWSKELEKRRVAEATGDNKKVTDIYKCRKCGERKSTTSQMQTRSADEPPTIFVTCLVCYNTFRTQ